MPASNVTHSIVKLLSGLSAKRLSEVAPALAQTMDLFLPLLKLDLPKEIETTTYLS